VVPTHASQIRDGGRPSSRKNRKIAISRLKFERRRRNLARWRSSTLLTRPTVKNLLFQKIPDSGGRQLKKSKKSRYLGKGLTDRHTIWHIDAIRHSRRVTSLKICYFENAKCDVTNQAPFRDDLSSMGLDLLRLTYIPNLKSLL